MRPIFEYVFGLAWTRALRGWPLILATLGALGLAAAAAAFAARVWPSPDSPELDPRGSPGVVRRGDRLEFLGTVPWTGRQTAGEQRGRRVSFGGEPPATDSAPAAWLHYSPDKVTAHSQKTGTSSVPPSEFERNARIGHLLLCLLFDFVIASVFFFSLTVLLRVKRAELPAWGPLEALARCVVPACVYQAAAMVAGSDPSSYLSVGVFILVLGMNAILFVLAAKPAPEEVPPFEV